MPRRYLLGAVGLAAAVSGTLLYMVTIQTGQLMNGVPVQASVDQQPVDSFQREQGLQVTGQANPETLAALGIEDRLYRRPR